MKIRLILTGRSYHNATALPNSLELPDNATLSQALEQVNQLLPDEAPLPASCLIAVAGQHVGSLSKYEDIPLSEGQELTLIAPVAGG